MPLTKWKNQQHWSQASLNFQPTMLELWIHRHVAEYQRPRKKKSHAHQGFDTLLLAKYPAVLCILILARHLAKRLWADLGFAKCLGGIKTPGTTKFPFQAPHPTVLDWYAAFQKAICLIPGSNLVI
jgi:hypothetical protein